MEKEQADFISVTHSVATAVGLPTVHNFLGINIFYLNVRKCLCDIGFLSSRFESEKTRSRLRHVTCGQYFSLLQRLKGESESCRKKIEILSR